MRKNILCFSLIYFLFIGLPSAGLGQEAPLIGDHSDGSRAVPVHLIPLVDEEGHEIAPDDDPLLPFSTHQTCALKCHSYEKISSGWHFNAVQPATGSVRPGHPWIWTDAATGTQIPLSYRNIPGTLKPEQAGIDTRMFLQRFGRQFPGGSVGESEAQNRPMRAMVSGKLEINCLACHDADPAHDQAEYAAQIARQNFRWAAASTAAFAAVSGSAKDMPDTYDYLMPEPPKDPKLVPPSISYHPNIFDEKQRVFFHIVRKIPNSRCYFCHSSLVMQDDATEKWHSDEDVHLTAGLACVDCHRNGINHDIVRGYAGESQSSGNPLADVLTCEGCHIPNTDGTRPMAGRMGAPIPQHKGIPLIHFQKLECTACHSGPWPKSQTQRVKTSLAHGLGNRNADVSANALPHILTPVYALDAQGKIAPHNLLWPSFWGQMEGERLTPLPIDYIQKSITPALIQNASGNRDGWRALTETNIQTTLASLKPDKTLKGKAVYVAGGNVYQLNEDGKLTESPHMAAQPYLWPLAHTVRPAAQALGVHGCQDCHSMKSPFFFGAVAIDTPLAPSTENRTMVSFEEFSPALTKIFALSFWFRPLFKMITFLSAGLIIAVILIYFFKGLMRILEYFGNGNKEKS